MYWSRDIFKALCAPGDTGFAFWVRPAPTHQCWRTHHYLSEIVELVLFIENMYFVIFMAAFQSMKKETFIDPTVWTFSQYWSMTVVVSWRQSYWVGQREWWKRRRTTAVCSLSSRCSTTSLWSSRLSLTRLALGSTRPERRGFGSWSTWRFVSVCTGESAEFRRIHKSSSPLCAEWWGGPAEESAYRGVSAGGHPSSGQEGVRDAAHRVWTDSGC